MTQEGWAPAQATVRWKKKSAKLGGPAPGKRPVRTRRKGCWYGCCCPREVARCRRFRGGRSEAGRYSRNCRRRRSNNRFVSWCSWFDWVYGFQVWSLHPSNTLGRTHGPSLPPKTGIRLGCCEGTASDNIITHSKNLSSIFYNQKISLFNPYLKPQNQHYSIFSL